MKAEGYDRVGGSAKKCEIMRRTSMKPDSLKMMTSRLYKAAVWNKLGGLAGIRLLLNVACLSRTVEIFPLHESTRSRLNQ